MTTEERNQLIIQQLNDGISLSAVQKLLATKGENITYFELRLLAADFEVNWEKHRPPEPTPEINPEPDPEPECGTQVTVSKLVRPGAAMSGDVVFASGAKAEWFLDGSSRLGLNPAKGSAKPTEDDIREFQAELQRKLSRG